MLDCWTVKLYGFIDHFNSPKFYQGLDIQALS